MHFLHSNGLQKKPDYHRTGSAIDWIAVKNVNHPYRNDNAFVLWPARFARWVGTHTWGPTERRAPREHQRDPESTQSHESTREPQKSVLGCLFGCLFWSALNANQHVERPQGAPERPRKHTEPREPQRAPESTQRAPSTREQAESTRESVQREPFWNRSPQYGVLFCCFC